MRVFEFERVFDLPAIFWLGSTVGVQFRYFLLPYIMPLSVGIANYSLILFQLGSIPIKDGRCKQVRETMKTQLLMTSTVHVARMCESRLLIGQMKCIFAKRAVATTTTAVFGSNNHTRTHRCTQRAFYYQRDGKEGGHRWKERAEMR